VRKRRAKRGEKRGRWEQEEDEHGHEKGKNHKQATRTIPVCDLVPRFKHNGSSQHRPNATNGSRWSNGNGRSDLFPKATIHPLAIGVIQRAIFPT
jgi:hypothetical protein